MASTRDRQVCSRLVLQRGASRARAIASLALMLSLITVVTLGLPDTPVSAQVVATAKPSVTVHGAGEASAPAETATVQLLIGHGGRQFGFSQDGAGGSSFSSGGSVSMSESGLVTEIGLAATPEASADAGAAAQDEGRRGRRGRSGPEPITAERLAPVVAAVATGGGIARDAVTIDLSPLATEPFGDNSQSARLDFEIARPDPDALNELVAAASDAAAANGMVVEVAGVRYNPADCAVVEAEAARAAIADARVRADRLAELLGVTLGDVVGASSDPYFGLDPEQGGCSGQQTSFYDSAYGGLGITTPVFDPSAPAEVEVYAVLTIAYEIVESEPG